MGLFRKSITGNRSIFGKTITWEPAAGGTNNTFTTNPATGRKRSDERKAKRNKRKGK